VPKVNKLYFHRFLALILM